jgi:hypothetical protein
LEILSIARDEEIDGGHSAAGITNSNPLSRALGEGIARY